MNFKYTKSRKSRKVNNVSGKRKTNRSRKNKKSKKGGNNTMVDCCMCGKEFNKKEMLTPAQCLKKHGMRAHKICQKCWWDKEKGFAKEGISHKCPGCEKNLPLTKLDSSDQEMVDLTEED
jgi:hypothetical protein